MILITAHGSIDLAIEAIKAGAQDYLTKPLEYAQLEALLEVSRSEVPQGPGTSPRLPAGRRRTIRALASWWQPDA